MKFAKISVMALTPLPLSVVMTDANFSLEVPPQVKKPNKEDVKGVLSNFIYAESVLIQWETLHNILACVFQGEVVHRVFLHYGRASSMQTTNLYGSLVHVTTLHLGWS